MNFSFFIKNVLLGAGLAMDACAVSMANGLKEAKMKINKTILIAFIFGFFQVLMPLIGYFVGHAILDLIEKFIPWMAFVLLLFVGIKMIIEAVKGNDDETNDKALLTFKTLLVQGVATSIDALSVGLTFADYTVSLAFISALIIAVVTFVISFIAVFIGKKFGTKFGSKAEIAGGIILILIGIEIFVEKMFF